MGAGSHESRAVIAGGEMNLREYEVMFAVESTYWWYRGMRELARGFAPRVFSLPAGARHLDAGCGTGANLSHVLSSSAGVRGHGVDLSLEGLRFCRRRGLPGLVQGSVTTLPFRDGSFESVTSHDVLGGVADDRGAVAEYFRVLAPGGSLYVSAAAFESLAGEHDRATHMLRRHTIPQLVDMLEGSGFTVERTSYANALLSIPIFLVRVARRRLFAASHQHESTSDFHLAPPAVNGLLLGLLRLEAWWLRRGGRLPFGVTALVLARKPQVS